VNTSSEDFTLPNFFVAGQYGVEWKLRQPGLQNLTEYADLWRENIYV
jgi:hypothetical protein